MDFGILPLAGIMYIVTFYMVCTRVFTFDDAIRYVLTSTIFRFSRGNHMIMKGWLRENCADKNSMVRTFVPDPLRCLLVDKKDPAPVVPYRNTSCSDLTTEIGSFTNIVFEPKSRCWGSVTFC